MKTPIDRPPRRIGPPAALFILLALACLALLGTRLSAQVGLAFVNTPEVQSATHDLKAKAAADECYSGINSGIARFTKPTTATPPCSDAPQSPQAGAPKVNQGYVWGMTQTSTDVWFGTFANGQCVTQGGTTPHTPTAFQTDAYVCEFGSSPYVPTPLPSALIGDFRPPRAYRWDKSLNQLTELTPVKPGAAPTQGFANANNPEGIFPLLAQTRGIRAATTFGNFVIMAGPNLDGSLGLTFFVWDATTKAFLGGRRLAGYSNIRHFTTVNGVLYTGVGKMASNCNTSCTNPVTGGRVLKLVIANSASCATNTFPAPTTLPSTPNIWSQINNPCFTLTATEVGNLSGVGAYLTAHTDGRIYVTTWPDKDLGPNVLAEVVMSPPVPGGGLTTADAPNWTRVWKADDYEPDPVVARTYAGGAIASFGGSLFWGTMHIPWQALGAFIQVNCPGQHNDPSLGPQPCNLDSIKQAAEATTRAIVIFRGKNYASGTPVTELLYGDKQLPVFTTDGSAPPGGTWALKPNNMAGVGALYGPSGFGNPWNNYTWAMTLWNNRLWVGTMDWSLLSQQGAAVMNSKGANIRADLWDTASFGGDLYYFTSATAPAFAESTNGVDNPTTYGVRNMVSSPDMFLGMANPMNRLTDPVDPHGFGGLGGWELIKFTPKYPENTPQGKNVGVTLGNGVTVNFCSVTNAGNTFSSIVSNPFHLDAEAPEFFDRFDWDGPSTPPGTQAPPEKVILLGSTAQWRDGCNSATLASFCAPLTSFPTNTTVPRLFDLEWTGSELRWVDITTTLDSTKICGAVTGKHLGLFAVMNRINYLASLKGDYVVPPQTNGFTGQIKIQVKRTFVNDQVEVNLTTGNMAGVTVADLHWASPGNNGPVIATLKTFSPAAKISGTLFNGSFTASGLIGPLAGHTIDDFMQLVANGEIYVDVHTTAAPNGAIRGNIR